MVVQISVAVIAVAFVALVVYAIAALRSMQESLKQATQTMANMEHRIDEISEESVKLLSVTNKLTEDLNGKLKQVDHFFESAHDIGEAVHQVTSSVKQVSATVTRSLTGSVDKSVHTHQSKIDNVMQWANAAISLWQQVSRMKENSKKQ